MALSALRDRKSKGSGGAVAVEKEAAVRSGGAGGGSDGKQRNPLSVIADPEPSVEQKMIRSEREARIRSAIDRLPAQQRTAVLLHKYHELDYKRIAKILSYSQSALKSLLFRAYESLRESLAPLVKDGLPLGKKGLPLGMKEEIKEGVK